MPRLSQRVPQPQVMCKLLLLLLPPGVPTHYRAALQAVTILVAMAREKNILRLNSGESRQLATNRLKEKTTWKIVNNRTNLINSANGGITCVSLFPPAVQKLDMNV